MLKFNWKFASLKQMFTCFPSLSLLQVRTLQIPCSCKCILLLTVFVFAILSSAGTKPDMLTSVFYQTYEKVAAAFKLDGDVVIANLDADKYKDIAEK